MIAAQGKKGMYDCLQGWQIFGVNPHGRLASGPSHVSMTSCPNQMFNAISQCSGDCRMALRGTGSFCKMIWLALDSGAWALGLMLLRVQLRVQRGR
jgi:hypothetical protein